MRKHALTLLQKSKMCYVAAQERRTRAKHYWLVRSWQWLFECAIRKDWS